MRLPACVLAILVFAACDETQPSATPVVPTAPVSQPFPGMPAVTGTPAPTATPVADAARAQADAAFNDAMRAYETGDPAAATLVPAALTAYGQVALLDNDGLFHVAVLQSAAGDQAAAIGTAEKILAFRPGHLLALGAGGRAAVKAGDAARARDYYQRLDAAFDQEQGQAPEYGDHANLLPIYRSEAQAWLTANGATATK